MLGVSSASLVLRLAPVTCCASGHPTALCPGDGSTARAWAGAASPRHLCSMQPEGWRAHGASSSCVMSLDAMRSFSAQLATHGLCVRGICYCFSSQVWPGGMRASSQEKSRERSLLILDTSFGPLDQLGGTLTENVCYYKTTQKSINLIFTLLHILENMQPCPV